MILCIGGADYWAYLVSMTVLGLGMAVSVAPLTTTVINAVPAHQTGVASGVNNAVASLAGLLAVAIFGAVALGLYDRGLDRRLQASSASVELRQTIQSARGNFVTTPAAAMSQGDDRQLAEMIIKGGTGGENQVHHVARYHSNSRHRQERRAAAAPHSTRAHSIIRH